MNDKYDVVIGLEVHAELKTNSKVFCACANKYGSEPNTNCCPICIGLPGALPVLNKQAVKSTIKAGLCMGCEINDIAVFERKNYFYPDLSKAYQISQLVKPICVGGGVYVNNGTKFIRLDRIHLEEDAGKLVHKSEQVGTLIDYNRGGVPLIEMVSMPDMSNADEAIEFLTQLRSNLIYAGIAECKMEQGGMRCDVNISIKKKGSTELGTRTEMKNLNSFKSVARAIEYETQRQIELVENGETVLQETRRWDDERGKSFSLRTKETSQDYRYFPDPDLLSVKIERSLVDEIKKTIPMLPKQRKELYINEYGLTEYDADVLTTDKEISDFYNECLTVYKEPKKVCNWVMTELLKYVEKTEENINIPIGYENFANIIKMVDSNQIGQSNAKKLIEMCFGTEKTAMELAKENNMLNDINADEVEEMVKKVIADNPKAVEDYKVNGDKVLTFFLGQVMRLSKGKAQANVVRELLIKLLG
ncbi:MAG: Asp-tRNA(Asn)/Glu-tRNA(Gln) amidotransferase subunit GatB [Clostridia bacterium]|nr:Asp-tRNA(Asn)/Glu-tRNA(Gln) amidotransferase subunit GatB [Clostridia bacterium]